MTQGSIQQGRQHWMAAFPQAWITNRPASTAASSKPGSEISSLVDSGDDSPLITRLLIPRCLFLETLRCMSLLGSQLKMRARPCHLQPQSCHPQECHKW